MRGQDDDANHLPLPFRSVTSRQKVHQSAVMSEHN